jgi:nitrite reductase/ring-hydroxylating ferredoxin subunit
VTCPWHFTPFNVMTGKAMEGGVTDDPVATYEVRLEGDDIQIRKG